jgi:CO dehydrogenase/acetyl-CoA synthase gamma subunit (corrinoid Fe-S protein)
MPKGKYQSLSMTNCEAICSKKTCLGFCKKCPHRSGTLPKVTVNGSRQRRNPTLISGPRVRLVAKSNTITFVLAIFLRPYSFQ